MTTESSATASFASAMAMLALDTSESSVTASFASAMSRLALDTSESSATASFASAMSMLALDTVLADLTVTCGDKEWKVHSTVLAVRSPFFKEAISNNMAEDREMKIDIEEFDPEAMDHVIEFMYGKIVEKGSFKFLFEAAERFQMDDLKEDVVKHAKKKMTVENVIEIGHLAENYDIEHLVGECAKFIVKNNVHMKEHDASPKLTFKVLSIYQEKQKAGNQNQENSEDKHSKEDNVSCINSSMNASVASLMSKLVEDHDQRDLIITCGDMKWKVHSVILAVRSPFFMAAVTNNMAEKRDMKIDIKDFEPEAMAEVINFMYGIPIGFGAPIVYGAHVKFLFEAAERFQMNDLKEDVIKFARKMMNLDNVVELGHLGEIYNIESFLGENFVATYQSLNGNGGKENNNDPAIDIRNVVRNKNAKIKKPCKYFNEGSCEVKRSHLSKSRLTQWLHVCRFCFAKYGNEKLHPESQCEYKKNANDEYSSGMPRSVDESKRNKKVGDEDENIMKEERRSWKREGSYENGDSKRRRSRSRERSSRSNYRSRSRERERSSERWNGREVKVDREAVEMDRSRDDHRKRSRYSQERERDRRGDVDRNREVDRSRKYEDGFKRTRQDLQVEDDHRISKRERDDREDLQARNSSLGHETASLSNQPRNAEASQLQYPEKTQEDEIQLLHRKVADCVKKRLNMYWAHIETTEPKNRKINDPEEYTKLAKHFSHRMRDQIKETYEQYERTLEGITLTADNREQIKTAIDMHFDSKPVIKLEGYRR